MAKKSKKTSPPEKPEIDESAEDTAIDVNLKELMRKQEEEDRANAGSEEEVTPTDGEPQP
jgi:hypothetical protein